jgi:glycosyltransferase involved in cell wall biosynthesis
MLRSLAGGAREHGWAPELGFSETAMEREWFSRLQAEFPNSVFTVPGGSRLETGRWLVRHLAQPGPALLHTHFTRFDLPAAWAGRRRELTAVVWHVHTPPYRDPRSRLRDTAKFGLLGRGVNAILASGPDPARLVIQAGARRSSVEIVGGGIETSRFVPASEEERRSLRAELSIPNECRMLLQFSWDWELKGGELFLEAVRSLVDSGGVERPLAVMVGGGDLGRTRARQLGLEKHVRIIEPTDQVTSLYGAADLFVSTSRMEGQPFAVIESILSGLPVVATDLAGHRDICGGLDSCRVVPRSPGEIGAAASALLGRPAGESGRTAAEARSQMVSRFDLGPWTERMLARYRAALAEVDPGAGRSLKAPAH